MPIILIIVMAQLIFYFLCWLKRENSDMKLLTQTLKELQKPLQPEYLSKDTQHTKILQNLLLNIVVQFQLEWWRIVLTKRRTWQFICIEFMLWEFMVLLYDEKPSLMNIWKTHLYMEDENYLALKKRAISFGRSLTSLAFYS